METQENTIGRQAIENWQKAAKRNLYQIDTDFQHSVAHYGLSRLDKELTHFANLVLNELDPLVIENNLASNLPRVDSSGAVVHHPSYEKAGNIIYGSRLLERMSKPGGLLEALTFMFLSSQAGEAGHNCPVACSAGIIRVLQKIENFPHKDFYIKMLINPSYSDNYTGAQFLTEIQGGSDVGLNATSATQDPEGNWRITGEKWFCSNADAELILLTARFDQTLQGTKGLGLFLVPAKLESGKKNHYTIKRLKSKIGTQSMATGEIDFNQAYAFPVGNLEEGFKLVMENVLHISRLFNTICVLAMARRAFHLALEYAKNRVAFGHPIIDYSLIRENLATIKAENTAALASIFATAKLQDDFDTGKIKGDEIKLLLRLLTNLNKYISAVWSVEHIHHSLDVLAGNGTIENFSIIPRLLKDCIVCENWEGTHNTLRMQILKDILRYHVDELFLNFIGKTDNVKIKEGISRLRNEVQELKKASPDIQSLHIKSVVDQMAILFCAIQLLKEGSPSKLRCLDYFIHLHLGGDDPHPLHLINATLQS